MVHAMPLQQRCGKVALQGSKTQTVMTISFQQKPNGAIAKTADAIVKNNWFGRRLMHDNTSNSQGEWSASNCNSHFGLLSLSFQIAQFGNQIQRALAHRAH